MPQQAWALRAHWPSKSLTVRRNTLRWVGTLRPSEVSPDYTVSLAYTLNKSPTVHVLDPQLDPGHRERLPHVYSEDRLCLYTPGRDWNRSMSLAETIVPWAAEWLFNYELWRATGDWTGGGHRYAPPDDGHLIR